MIRLYLATAITLVSLFHSISSMAASSGDQIGFRCSAYPCTKDQRGRNVCLGASEQRYPGVLMIVAKRATIARCKTANALDYGTQFGKSCSGQCADAAQCYPYAG